MNASAKKIIHDILSICFYPFKYMVPKGNVVIMHAYNRNVYCDNTKYLFEFMSKANKNYDIRWLTDNDTIIKYLIDNNLKYVTTKKPIELLFLLLRTILVVDTGNKYFNPFNITNNKNTLKLSTMHGCGPKVSHSRSNDIMTAVQQIFNANSFDYVNFPTIYSSIWIGKRIYLLPNEKVISLGYPRCDQYFDKNMVLDKYRSRKLSKELNPKVKLCDRIVLYTPTWRPYKYNFPLENMIGMNYRELETWLESNNICLFFSVHSVNIPENICISSGRVTFINPQKHPLFDINEFMNEVDLLLNDYSTTSVEFSLLKRPQIFFMPDYEYYEDEKGFAEDYRKSMPGREVASFDELKETIMHCLEDKEKYLDTYESKRLSLLSKYYDSQQGDSAHRFSGFIDELLVNK